MRIDVCQYRRSERVAGLRLMLLALLLRAGRAGVIMRVGVGVWLVRSWCSAVVPRLAILRNRLVLHLMVGVLILDMRRDLV
jgi:hypothetical protein